MYFSTNTFIALCHALFLDEACWWAEKFFTDINLPPLIPDEDNIFGSGLILDLESDDVMCIPRIG